MRVITGTARGRALRTVKGQDVRPTSDRVKETLFNVLAARLPEARFLDLFAGSGAVGIEALSRGAAACTFVELQSAHLQVIEANLRTTELEAGAQVLRRDARAALVDFGRRSVTFDLIFVDPPYGIDLIPPVLEAIVAQQLLAPDAWVICEHHRKDPVPPVIKDGTGAGGLMRFRELVLGETVLSFYRRG